MVQQQNCEALSSQVFLFIDTNVFIHFDMYDSVDWHAIMGTNEVILVMDGVVLEELDRFKDDHSNPGRRDRVRDVLAKFQKLGESGSRENPTLIRKGISIFPLVRSPKPNWSEQGLDPSRNDDRLLGSMVQFRDENPDHRIAFITNDTTPRLKAKRYQIEVQSPAGVINEVKLSNEQEKEIRRLRTQVSQYEMRMPSIDVKIAHKGSLSRFLKINTPSDDTEHLTWATLGDEVENIRRDYMRAIHLHQRLFPSHYEDFLRELDMYLDDYRLYRWRTWLVEEAVRIDLNFGVENSGSGVASDVEVQIDIPNAAYIVDSDDVPKWITYPKNLVEPKRPKIPSPPGAAQRTGFATELYESLGSIIPTFGLIPSPSIPTISTVSTNTGPKAWKEGNTVLIEHPNLKSKRHWISETFFVYVGPLKSKGFEMPYKIHCNEMTEEKTGTLRIVLG